MKKNSIKLQWSKIKGADGYIIYGNRCGTKNRFKQISIVKGGSKTSYTQKKLKKGTYYKYIVAAYKEVNGGKVILSTSKTLHIVTSGGKYSNAASVKVPKTKVTISKNKKYTIKAKEVYKKNAKKKTHRKIAYESTNTKIATVTSKGVVKGKKKGTCYIYAYAQNGTSKKIKITVK